MKVSVEEVASHVNLTHRLTICVANICKKIKVYTKMYALSTPLPAPRSVETGVVSRDASSVRRRKGQQVLVGMRSGSDTSIVRYVTRQYVNNFRCL